MRSKIIKITEAGLLSLLLISLLGFSIDSQDKEKLKDKNTQIKAYIIMLLKQDTPWSRVKIHASHGELQAAGFVDDEKQRQQISKILKKFEKNYKLHNDIFIASKESHYLEDERLITDIKYTLEELNYFSEDICIQSHNGNVILSGFVDSQVNIDNAAKVVAQMQHVKRLHNCLMHRA